MTGIKKITYDFSNFDIQKKLIDLETKNLPKEKPIDLEKTKKTFKKTLKEQQRTFDLQLRKSNLNTGIK